MPVQDWVHHWSEGAGGRVVRIVAALLAFVALAALYDRFTIYDLTGYENYSSEEAMESAQLARNIAEGKGYTTDSIRPVALYLLAGAADPGQSSQVLAQPVPDLTTPPVYPYVLAGLMKALPFEIYGQGILVLSAGEMDQHIQPGAFLCRHVVAFFPGPPAV